MNQKGVVIAHQTKSILHPYVVSRMLTLSGSTKWFGPASARKILNQIRRMVLQLAGAKFGPYLKIS